MRAIIYIIALAAIFFGRALAHAGGYGGYTHYERGFYLLGTPSHNDGNWYVVRDGCYVFHSRFRRSQAAAKPTVRYSADWKSDLVKALEKKKDHELFLQALRESGLQSPDASALGDPGGYYGAASGTSTYSYGYIPSADQGGTIYGVEAFAPNIGKVDIEGLMNQQMRLVERLSEGTNVANNAVSDRIGQLADAQAEVAKIQAAGRVLVETVRAAQAPATATHTWRRETGPAKQGVAGEVHALRKDQADYSKSYPSAPPSSATALVRAEEIFDRSCVKCHGPQKAQAGLNLSGFATWSDAQRALAGPKIVARVLSRDAGQRMPPEPNAPLSADDLKVLLRVFP